ncbi:hemerythrin [Alginatibacterium sediminis]|uniref:Hemerythrin n=1 Tax=Alginatibacterium sediminis TaxID=2164068 RepID=A0A420EDW5_9ALTE|nr:hemerythrin domain-containing protein [Alginatibacterium sediminis]RKF18860.1 hemerythrin [Alginatibacterium sediminis]
MLQSIHEDHVNISKLLRVLEQKLEAIRGERAVKYKLILDIITYLQEYADRYHHPKEDLIYDYYVKYRLVGEDLANKLKLQHSELHDITEELRDTVEVILLDAVVPLDQFADRLEAFVKAQWAHLNYEEEEVFPMLKKNLTEDDWRNLEQNWQHGNYEDPLFGHQVQAQYRSLSDRIEKSDSK